MKIKKIAVIVVLVLIAGSLSFLGYQKSKKSQLASQVSSQEKQSIPVSIKSYSDSKSLTSQLVYPAVISGDQEITLTAKTSGTITDASFNLGDKVSQGRQLVTIDDTGNQLTSTEKGLKSSQIQQLELAVEQAEESYKLAKKNYQGSKTYANKKAKEIAELQHENAKIGLKGALDTRFVVSPISGTITDKLVSVGDSVNIGQTLAKISKTDLMVVQFYVNSGEISNFKPGTGVFLETGDNEKIAATIMRISPQADAVTRRFLIEAKPVGKNSLYIGNVVNVSLEIRKNANFSDSIILPLSAITVGQNESYIFVVENSQAKKVNVIILNVDGESAEIKSDLQSNAQIIVNGSKLVQDGDLINVL